MTEGGSVVGICKTCSARLRQSTCHCSGSTRSSIWQCSRYFLIVRCEPSIEPSIESVTLLSCAEDTLVAGISTGELCIYQVVVDKAARSRYPSLHHRCTLPSTIPSTQIVTSQDLVRGDSNSGLFTRCFLSHADFTTCASESLETLRCGVYWGAPRQHDQDLAVRQQSERCDRGVCERGRAQTKMSIQSLNNDKLLVFDAIETHRFTARGMWI